MHQLPCALEREGFVFAPQRYCLASSVCMKIPSQASHMHFTKKRTISRERSSSFRVLVAVQMGEHEAAQRVFGALSECRHAVRIKSIDETGFNMVRYWNLQNSGFEGRGFCERLSATGTASGSCTQSLTHAVTVIITSPSQTCLHDVLTNITA